jgi:hypothetical protein
MASALPLPLWVLPVLASPPSPPEAVALPLVALVFPPIEMTCSSVASVRGGLGAGAAAWVVFPEPAAPPEPPAAVAGAAAAALLPLARPAVLSCPAAVAAAAGAHAAAKINAPVAMFRFLPMILGCS